jgi:hypothetical protein
MARMRSTKPEFWGDQELCQLPRDTRMLYHALWNFADEEGRAQGEPRLIKGNCFPLDDDITLEIIVVMLAQLAKVGRVVRYTVHGALYLYLPKLAQHQRLEPERVPSRLPPPPEGGEPPAKRPRVRPNQSPPDLNEQSPDLNEKSPVRAPAHVNLLPATGRSSRETARAENGHAPPEQPDPFDEFWSAYPRRVAKPDAKRAFARVKVPVAEVMAGLAAWANYWARDGTQLKYVPYPATFLNQCEWQDIPPPVGVPSGPMSRDDANNIRVEQAISTLRSARG